MPFAFPFPGILRLPLTVSCLLTGLTACDPGPRVEITDSRTASEHRPLPKTGLGERERLGLKGPQQHPLIWEAPEHWQPEPQGRMRLINYSFGSEGKGECYVTILPGDGGGVAANLDRWRGQMELPPFTREQLGELELRPFLGTQAYFVDMEGSYRGFGSTDGLPGYRMLGIIQDFGQLTASVKMVGPADAVASEAENFSTFCASIRFRQSDR